MKIAKRFHFEGGTRYLAAPSSTLVRDIAEVRGLLEKLARLGCSVSLQLMECRQEHVDALADAYAHVYAISIMGSPLTSVEAIKNVPDIRLLDCHALIDINALGSQKCVRICNCPVKDISCLAGVKTLEISNCEEITSISCLGRQDRLCVAYCPHVIDFAAVARVPYLSIRGSNLTELFDAENETLQLSGCVRLTDIGRLRDVKRLSIYNCPLITAGLHVLASVVEELRIEGVLDAPTLPLLPVLRARTVDIRQGALSKVACLRNATNVTLVRCLSVHDVAPLRHARKVCLEQCTGVRDVTPLRNVPILHLFSINADCSCLGSQYSLALGNVDWCDEMNNLAAGRDASYNCPFDCSKLLNCYGVRLYHHPDAPAVRLAKVRRYNACT